MSESMVKAEAVHKRFGRNEVLKGITLDVAPGEVMCLLGPSGSGETTLLNVIGCILDPSEGTLGLDGELVFDFVLRLGHGLVIVDEHHVSDLEGWGKKVL